MRTVLIVSALILLIAISFVKEGVAEAAFKAWFYSSCVACTSLVIWVAARLRQCSRRRKYNAIRLQRQIRDMQMGRYKEPLTEYEFDSQAVRN